MSTLQENLDRIKKAKSAIKDAIIQKGIDVTDTEKIETYADKILQIKSGGGTEIPEFDPNGPLTIYCFDDWNGAYVQFSNNFTNGKVYYSKDKETWTQYKGEILKLTKGEFVQFKGDIITVGSSEKHFTIKNGLFNLYGNLTSLDNYNDVLSESVFYRSMFEKTNLYDCSNLNFGITYIQRSTRNFEGMFKGCSFMKSCPKILPATTLTEYCYSNMFSGCIGLTTVPNLPATTLAYSCYQYMFQNCTSLTTIPSNLLPATTLAYNCYQYMFDNCTSLTTIPSNLLPATTLADSCYKSMFSYCTGLTTIPNLPATTLASSCYESMFSGCTSLVETPDGWILKAQTTASSSCYAMFGGCSKLQKMAVAYSGTITASHWRSFLYNVSSTGTFFYSKNQTKENIQSIVPKGWTLVQSTSW